MMLWQKKSIPVHSYFKLIHKISINEMYIEEWLEPPNLWL